MLLLLNVLEFWQARFVVSVAYSPPTKIAAHHMVHGDGWQGHCPHRRCKRGWRETTARCGGKSACEVKKRRMTYGIPISSAIYTYGETVSCTSS